MRHHTYESFAPPFETLPERLLQTLIDTQSFSAKENTTKAVRIEDVHSSPKKVMEKLIDWIGIKWEPICYRALWMVSHGTIRKVK